MKGKPSDTDGWLYNRQAHWTVRVCMHVFSVKRYAHRIGYNTAGLANENRLVSPAGKPPRNAARKETGSDS